MRVLGAVLLLSSIDALPLRGNDPWTVVLCKLSDNNHEPMSHEWVREWISGWKQDSISSFFRTLSNGIYTIDQSNVTEWIQIPWSSADIQKMAEEETGDRTAFAYFDKVKQLCAGWASSRGIQVNERRIVLLNSEATAVFGRASGVLISPRLAFSAVLAHEMVHSMNIGHSYSERRSMVFPHGAPGEYGDRFDLMSTANAWMHATRFGWNGPGLAGPHLDFLGWLPQSRMAYFGGNQSEQVVRLSSLSLPHTHTRGLLLLQIPFDRNEPGNMFTVELRTPHGLDSGLKKPSILIHKVLRTSGRFYSYLVGHGKDDELAEGSEWVRFIDKSTIIRVRFDHFLTATEAVLFVQSTFDPTLCARNEVAIPVVMTSEEKMNGRIGGKLRKRSIAPPPGVELKMSMQRRPPVFNRLRMNVVRVCSNSKKNFSPTDIDRWLDMQQFFTRRSFGQNECSDGRVWRGVDEYDYVCVLPHRFAETRHAEASRLRFGGCPRGYTRRRAFEADYACVSPTEYALVVSENRATHRFYKHAAFFNGNDELIRR
ncbi:hypothetical protein PMAYCL1PPCAC_09706 [Pristionchus mayeri]|uniref:Metallopeptidase n=1 Tax=Pristionchus mayeri TaxID=1317129 RepID=A0AAN4ZEW1_9BILA|nr:hypothetical protein PMAYCL1PPCAC_09706 [Pristionchus mayeri]